MANRAECVMLNKGPYILDAIRMLDGVLARMEGHQHKKTPQLRVLHSWQAAFSAEHVGIENFLHVEHSDGRAGSRAR